MAEKTRKNLIKTKCAAFLESKYFPLVLGGIALLGYLFALPLTPLILFGISFILICLWAEDTRPALAVVLLAFLSLRYKYQPEEYLSPLAVTSYILFGGGVVAALLYRLVVTPKIVHKRTLLISFIIFSVGILLGGIGSSYYDFHSFVVAGSTVAVILAIYLFFTFTMKNKEDNLEYVARVCAVAIFVIACQLLELYAREFIGKRDSLDGEWKEYHLILGWGISNLVGEMLVVLLPAVFYLIYKQKHGNWYYLLVAIACVATYFTLARGALLCGCVILLAGIFANCIFNKRRWLSIVLLCLLLLSAVGVLVYLEVKEEVSGWISFFVEAGWSDRGRFELWSWCFQSWKESPVFGDSFSLFNAYPDQQKTLFSAHNTILQVLSATGGVGLVTYLIHRVHSVWLVLRKPTLDKLFMGACVVAGLVVSLIGPLFFRVYFLIYYTAILMTIEKTEQLVFQEVEELSSEEEISAEPIERTEIEIEGLTESVEEVEKREEKEEGERAQIFAPKEPSSEEEIGNEQEEKTS